MSRLLFFILLLFPFSAVAQDVEASDSLDIEEYDTLAVDSIAPPLPWPESLQAALDSVMAHSKVLKTAQLGLAIYDLTADSMLYSVNDRYTMRPASVMKLVTAITALDKLGESYRFTTRLYYDGEIVDSTLVGDIYCVGGFDPRFNSDDMRAFVEEIKELGIDTIDGRIVADVSMKDSKEYGEGWCWDDDNAVLSPLLISRKDEFLSRFVSALSDAGIYLKGYTSKATVPATARCISSRYHSIDQILYQMMKESDNLYAESMFYQIAASTGKRYATAKDAATVIRQLIQKVGLDPQTYRIADGSGLSLYNYVSAELIVRLLRYAYGNSNIYQNLLPTLPVAGVDGTLKSRMNGTKAAGNVYAKTGTVSGVSSLAGYVTSFNGHELCFAIILNGLMKGSRGRALQNRICTLMAEK